jgi:hypothetical protein
LVRSAVNFLLGQYYSAQGSQFLCPIFSKKAGSVTRAHLPFSHTVVLKSTYDDVQAAA